MKTLCLSMIFCCACFLQGCGDDSSSLTTNATEAAFPANLQSFVAKEDTDNDGSLDAIHSFQATYDESGRITASTWECDHNYNGTIDNNELDTYNDDGKLAQENFFFDDDGDYLIDTTETAKYSYGPGGRLVQKVINTDNGQDGEIDTTTTYTYSYDPDGNRIGKTKEKVSAGVESGYTESYAYGFFAAGKLDSYTVTKSDPDAATDESTTHSFAYDAAGNLEEVVVSTDSDNDGAPDDIRTTTFAYLNADYLQTVTGEWDTNGDGVADMRYSEKVTYDAANRPILVEDRSVNLADDTATWSATQTITYTADGKGGETQATFDKDGDGIVDSSDVYELSFTTGGMTNRTYPVAIAPGVTVPVPLVVAINESKISF